MSRKTIITIVLVLEVLLLAAAVGAFVFLEIRDRTPDPTTPAATTTAPVTTATPTTQETTVPETTEETTVPVTTEPEPQPIYYTLSFAGDCTLGNFKDDYGSVGSFMGTVGDNYAYPFEKVQQWFAGDDFTLVNFEGTLTDHTGAVDKTFNFHAPPAYAAILTAGSVEGVTISNNHTMDYGEIGYADTVAALKKEGIAFAGTDESFLYITETGLKIGVYANKFWLSDGELKKGIESLREQGAEIVIFSMHWGEEGAYKPTVDQKYYAHAAIDYGADIVFGHHPHVLQPIEEYGGGYILYSMGNFSFGGNRWPSDTDSAIVQVEVMRDVDGLVHLEGLNIVPVSISGEAWYNNYQPVALEPDTWAYQRVLDKLSGAFEPPKPPEPEETTVPTVTEEEEPTDSSETT